MAVSLNIDHGVRLIKLSKLYMCTQKHYKYNKDRCTVPDVYVSFSVPLIHSGHVITKLDYNNNKSYLPGKQNCSEKIVFLVNVTPRLGACSSLVWVYPVIERVCLDAVVRSIVSLMSMLRGQLVKCFTTITRYTEIFC